MKEYKKIQQKYIDEISSNVTIYEHIKSGAKICTMENNDNNKVFSIGFRTPPINSTGLTHILEHSVLCGSRKYPVKDPFVELMKSSLNTFLNAFTFPDKTIYPVASLNDKDFSNLMDIYLDAVFYPNIYKYKEIFMQEGWHYELNNKDEDIVYNGVVYNEMKGAFSDPEQILFRLIMSSLFPDTAYGLESGGDPKYIPNLSYEEFLNFHKKYYHPSNSYIFIYGNCNMEEKLKYLDDEYLSSFNKIDFDTKIKYQNPFNKPVFLTSYYEDNEENTYLSYNLAFKSTFEIKDILALDILISELFTKPSAPIKEALNKENIGTSIETMFDDGLLQPVLSIYLTGAKASDEERFIKIIEDEFKKAINGALDKKAIEASIRFYEYKESEKAFSAHFPQGLGINITLLSSWLYDDNHPFDKLEIIKYYKELLNDLYTGYFENLIDTYLLNNNHKSFVKLVSSPNYNQKEDEALKNKLQKYKESLSEKEINELIETNKKLKIYQSEETSQEALDTLPKLKKEDIKIEALKANLEIIKDKYEILFSEYDVNNICYISYLFDITDISYEELKYLNLYSRLFLYLNSKNYTNNELLNKIKSYTGGIYTGLYTYIDDKNKVHIKLKFDFSSLKENIKIAKDLTDELIYNLVFDNKEKIRHRLVETLTDLKNSIVSGAHIFASNRAFSYISDFFKIGDVYSGLDFIYFLNDIVNDFDNQYETLIKKLNNVSNLFSKKNFILTVTASKENFLEIKPMFDEFYHKLEDELNYEKHTFIKDIKNEGLKAPYNVNYVSKVGKLNIKSTGELDVLLKIINTAFLWNKVRVLGGAYGVSMSITRNGYISLKSYRDPNIKSTYEAYEDLIDYIRNLNISDEELYKYKIGALGDNQLVLHKKDLAFYAFKKYLTNTKYEEDEERLKSILNAKLEDLTKYADVIKDALKEDIICTIGNQNKIEENKSFFKEIRDVNVKCQ